MGLPLAPEWGFECCLSGAFIAMYSIVLKTVVMWVSAYRSADHSGGLKVAPFLGLSLAKKGLTDALIDYVYVSNAWELSQQPREYIRDWRSSPATV
jgi:hypothetical protein